MRQIATSKRIYPTAVIVSIRVLMVPVNQAEAQYTPTRDKTIWPALMLAASRNDRVRGRTKILVVSIKTKNGFSQSGAPSGRKWAVDFLGLWENLEIIILSQMGRPRVRVKIRCLDELNVYGIRPIKLIITMRRKIVEIRVDNPFKWSLDVRVNWAKIVFFTGALIIDKREFIVQKDDWIINTTKVFETRNIELDGNIVLYI